MNIHAHLYTLISLDHMIPQIKKCQSWKSLFDMHIAHIDDGSNDLLTLIAQPLYSTQCGLTYYHVWAINLTRKLTMYLASECYNNGTNPLRRLKIGCDSNSKHSLYRITKQNNNFIPAALPLFAHGTQEVSATMKARDKDE